MYCPCCKSEYREGITHCVDCDVDLLEQLPESGTAVVDFKDTKANGRLIKLLTVEDSVEAELIANLLKNNGILCLKQEASSDSYMKLYRGTSIYGEDLYVNESDYEEAKKYCKEIFLKQVEEQQETVQEKTKQSQESMPTQSYRYIRFLTRLILGLALGSIAIIMIGKLILSIV